MNQAVKPRARELGLPLEGTPGRWNTITDVPGVEVGYHTLIDQSGLTQNPPTQTYTGVTAILPRGRQQQPNPIWAGQYDLNGNGELTGSHWIQDAGYFISPICITNTHSVGMAHHATTAWMIDQYREYFRDYHSWAMPVIAETYDGVLNDICGQRLKEEHVLSALHSAKTGPVAEGNVGGGAGMQTYEFKGGSGTSSRIVNICGKQYTVAAFVQSNFGLRPEFKVCGVPIGQHMTENALVTGTIGHETGSIIAIIATDIPMLPIQLQRLAKRGAIGIGRTGSYGGHFSGDIMLAFSTANDIHMPALGAEQPASFNLEMVNDAHCDLIHEAAVQAVEESVLNAMVAAESVPTIKPAGHVLEAIDTKMLQELMREYNRLEL
ncbi:Peptidase family S58 [Microbulbifer aggregans]|uniref:Peptidase family S58 n=1 Tax=Microbulbifer aggregans TaxID=1769779 RepID=A0A1C9W4C1_9GAMM|nr:P1 family peptidase [Microbulbifer aggregans]AOS95997.1 Peptidase family S58 [Microbulbifer aggregans]